MIALRDDIEGRHVRGRCDGRRDAAGGKAYQADLIDGLDVKHPLSRVGQGDKECRAAVAGRDKRPGIPGCAHPDFVADEIERRDRFPRQLDTVCSPLCSKAEDICGRRGAPHDLMRQHLRPV